MIGGNVRPCAFLSVETKGDAIKAVLIVPSDAPHLDLGPLTVVPTDVVWQTVLSAN